MAFLEVKNVSKRFGDYAANDDVSLSVESGKIFGLLGPNGAGKTTLIRIITRILMPDAGEVFFDNQPHKDAFVERIGYMPEERGLYKNMTIGEQLLYLAQLKGLNNSEAKSAVSSWFKKFDIESWQGKKVDELSKGMGQKVQFIATILHNPDLIILDEPFSGLDPINSKLIEGEIFELARQGKTIIFSTHRMEQVEEICTDIALINKGKNILTGNVKELRNQFKKHIFSVTFAEGKLPESNQGFEVLRVNNGEAIIKSELPNNELLKLLLESQVAINSFNEVLPRIHDIFIEQVNASNA